MQKLFFVLPAALALLLCGCQPPANTAVDARELKKAQQIEVIPAGETDATEIITDQGEIEDFVETLDVPGWVLESLPDGAEPIGVFQLSQEATLHPGQAETDGTLYDTAALTLYDDGWLTLETGGLDMAFSLQRETADNLAAYFR